MATEKEIYNVAKRIYRLSGQSQVEQLGDMLLITRDYCPACDNEEPVLSDNTCLVCGTEVK